MTILFPVRKFTRIAYNNKTLTYIVFVLYIASYSAYKDDTVDPYNVFEIVEKFSLPAHVYIFKLLYSPLGHLVSSLTITFLFLYVLYIFSNVKSSTFFSDYSIPFINIAFLISLTRILKMMLGYFDINSVVPDIFGSVYAIICFVMILNKEYQVNLVRSVLATASALSFLVLCGFAVFPGIGILLEKLGL
jgi:hypothetical protein